MGDIIQLENKFYISVNSTYADDRVRVLNHIDSFGIFDRWGDIKQLGEEVQGIYHNGMRYISELQLRINGKRPLLLSSSVKEKNEILSVDLTNPILQGEDRTIQKDEIYIGRSKFIRNGSCYERIRLNNYGTEFCKFTLSIEFAADFKDIFEVRGITRERRGEITEIRHSQDGRLRISYLGLDGVTRITQICFVNKPDSWENHNKVLYNIEMPPHDEQYIEYTIQFLTEKEDPHYLKFLEAQDKLNHELEDATQVIAKLTASNDQLNQWIERSQHDLISLLADTTYGKYPYAGVPWYNTAFGRDGIITALETLWVAPDIARDVLRYLAHTQATEINAYQDAEPGKIIHEVRGGEMVAMNEIPFKRYYGSVDSTPLFIMLAGAYYTRTAAEAFIKEIWPNIKSALDWIDTYGDINGDGFIEYQHKSVNGLTNQGWKDSHDSIMYEDGRLAESPIAPCEVQGYVYDAKIQAAKLARLLNDNELADKLDQQAATLKQRFNEVFWDEELSCYVLALDGKGKPCRVVSSNAGHTLFTSIADKDKAKKLVERLFQPDMFNGWGIRTLGKNEKRYNPMSYHNGSIWPHDVSLIARGLSKYGYTEETLKLATSLFDASLFIELQRLPELFCGFDRRKGEGPTNYPVACSPQAWAVATVYMLLESCLHIDIYAEQKKVYFYNPVIPVGTEKIFIHQLKLGDGYADLELYTENGTVGVKIKTCPPGWQVFIVTEKTVGNMQHDERQYA